MRSARTGPAVPWPSCDTLGAGSGCCYGRTAAAAGSGTRCNRPRLGISIRSSRSWMRMASASSGVDERAVCWHTCNERRSSFLTISTRGCATKPSVAGGRCQRSPEKPSRLISVRAGPAAFSPQGPAPAVAMTSPNASTRFSPPRSIHRPDRRRRTALRVRRPRRPTSRCEPRPPRDARRATHRADARRHRGDLPPRRSSRC